MKLKYDNLEDAKVKLVGTYCYFRGQAVIVKQVTQNDDIKKYNVAGTYMSNGRQFSCEINDPLFNCSEFNIGYVNLGHAAAWFYRVPHKQYRQGLRYDQCRSKYSSRAYSEIQLSASKPVACMMENSYPKLLDSVALLKANEATIMAFNKDFAVSFDRIHEDFLLEYKGCKIGFTHEGKKFKLLDEFGYLNEALKEAVQ